MSEDGPDLSPRYYVAEAAVWFLGATLLVAEFSGLTAEQSVPFLDLTPARSEHFARIVASLLGAAALYLTFEWKQSSGTARRARLRFARLAATLVWGALSFALSATLVFRRTRFEGTSPLWYFGFAILGYLIGKCVGLLGFAALMIRSPEEAERLQLPRIPVATRAQFTAWVPAILVLVGVYFAALYLCPPVLRVVSLLLLCAGFVFASLEEVAFICFARDERGAGIPIRQRVRALRQAFDVHDYAHVLGGVDVHVPRELKRRLAGSPRRAQETMRQRYTFPEAEMPVRFRVETQERLQLSFYPKDGDPQNAAPANQGVRIQKDGGEDRVISVRVVPEDSSLPTKDVQVAIEHVEQLAEEHLEKHTGSDPVALQGMLCYALNEAVSSLMVRESKWALHNAVTMGLESAVQMLLTHGADPNEVGAAGWTPLLIACAQGYPQIARALLDRGANPDVANVSKITPLHYAARYGNVEICRLLLEYGAAMNPRDLDGETPLMIAARFGNAEAAQVLIDAGADVDVKNRKGESALDLAHRQGAGGIAKALRRRRTGGSEPRM